MYDAGALWIAAKYQIPLLIVMYNNRAYYNDWNHQIVVARTRGTDPNRAHIGMDLFGPAPDFAGLARSMGWWAEVRSRTPTIRNRRFSGRWRRSRMASRRWSTGDPASMRPKSCSRKSRESGKCRLSSYARAAKLPRGAPPRRAAGRSQAGGNGHGHATRARPHQD